MTQEDLTNEEPQQQANLLPFLQPLDGEGLEQMLTRAAQEHHWPQDTVKQDLDVFRNMLSIIPQETDRVVLAGYLLRSLSFAAEPTMALRHLFRYIQARGERGAGDLMELRNNPEHLHFLASLFSFSNYLSDIVISRPDFLDWVFRKGKLSKVKVLSEYRAQLTEELKDAPDRSARQRLMTAFKKRELLRIGIRDIMEHGHTKELCSELSDLAQACLERTTDDALAMVEGKHGAPIGELSGQKVGFCVYAMGKFGAGELNFSSDIDLIYVYDDEGTTEGVPEGLGGRPVRCISNHEFFTKVAIEIAGFMSDSNPEGFLFRVDARLRPEGIDGPLVRSRPGYVSYLANQAGLWEKLPYMKARFVAGDEVLARIFDPIIEQFVYTGNVPDLLIPEIAHMKRRIDFEALSAEGRVLDIKRGSGGIREIEFIVAGLQLVFAEEHPALRVRPTLDAMELLVKRDILEEKVANKLSAAYHLFRRIEHTLQMMNEAQTHRLPALESERAHLALRCGFLKPEDFEKTLDDYRQLVRETFEKIFRVESQPAELTLEDYLFGEKEPPQSIIDSLKPMGLGNRQGFDSLRSLAVGTSEFSPSTRGRMSFQKLLPMMLEELPLVAMPHQAVRQFDLLLRAAMGHTWIYEFCLSHPPMLKMLLRTLGFGSMLARLLIAHPEWLDEIFSNGGLMESRTESMLADVCFPADSDQVSNVLTSIRRFKNLEGFLISVQEVLAITPPDDAARRMGLIAEKVINSVAEIVVASQTQNDELPARWTILGLGGLGDHQVHFNGDLDIAIVYEPIGEESYELAQRLDRIFHAFIKEIASYTPEGQLWKIDARLRPDGAGGSLCVSRKRFLEYYRENAGIWEWQVLTKARPVAGDSDFGTELLQSVYDMAPECLRHFDLKQEVAAMRGKMESAIKLPRNITYDMKHSPGGVVDLEFMVQCFQLLNADRAVEIFPLTTEEALALLVKEEVFKQGDGNFLVQHLANLRMNQRLSRLLFETNNDYIWEDKEKVGALRRGIEDQRILNGLPGLKDLGAGMKRCRELFNRYLK